MLTVCKFFISIAMLSLMCACGGGGGASPPSSPLANNASPAADFSVSLLALVTGQELQLNPSASTDPDGRVVKYDWSFGDGSSASSTSAAFQYKSWTSAGTKILTLTVTDDKAATHAVSKNITVASFAPTGLLNDTGSDWCTENISAPGTWVNNVVCSLLSWAGNFWGQQQDAYSGRDAQARAGSLMKVGSGSAGFDFTRLGANGQALSSQNGTWNDNGSEFAGTRWDCLRDNVTGLVWEAKRNDPAHLRHYQHRYSWYNTDATQNGGHPGFQTPFDFITGFTMVNACVGVVDASKCNTQSYTDAVNALPTGQALCGFRDWRLPTVDELASLVHAGQSLVSIDRNQFANTPYADADFSGATWSSTPFAPTAVHAAWLVRFTADPQLHGSTTLLTENYGDKWFGFGVRLVRSGQ
jgi:Protein of unknown function (DUF1566)/PKD domain